MVDKQFPLATDSEPIFEDRQPMNLYEESDFISNIKGDYQEKSFYDWAPISTAKLENKELPVEEEFKTDAALGREKARESVRQKRSASYLQDDPNQVFRQDLKRRLEEVQPLRPQEEAGPDYRKYGQKLSQDQYILADLRGRTKKSDKKASKDSYDFLRKSQIYQEKEQKVSPRQTNQELDLRKLTNEREKQ
ncbi:cystathionine gamma-synthase [Streptococcus danieliae]|uniref:Cystathionine gamma-synthase n=1 Tax=Streptococcus danieliae TaxID=747656 RepID=A0A7Z0LDH4_9STRE|nr:cystathionine gamma-synthase [Streptococcus danieliae]MBF0717361.1 cystathionine gamma-synthase [Streptococcus danieliae]NYS49291.1 cystathionine gamma-synthase [Streptococcus danieliae]